MPSLFLQKLRCMLSDPLCDTSLKWSSCGNQVIILDEKALTKQFKRYFKHSKMSSFLRQMNYYRFKKEVGASVYANPLFRADSSAEEIAQIERLPNTGNNEKRARKRKANSAKNKRRNNSALYTTETRKRKACSGNSDTDCFAIDDELALVEWPFCFDDALATAFDVGSTPNKKARRAVSPLYTPEGKIQQMMFADGRSSDVFELEATTDGMYDIILSHFEELL